jgi:hypothetical protein
VAAVLVLWTEALITTLKVAVKEDWPIAHTGHAMDQFFKAIPFRSEVIILMESADVAEALKRCEWLIQRRLDPFEYLSSPKSRHMMAIWKNKGVLEVHRAFGEE